MEDQIVLMLSTLKKIGLATVCTWFPKSTKDELIETINASEKLELKDNMVCIKEKEISEATRAWMNI